MAVNIDTGNASISIADAEVNCDVRSGSIQVTMSAPAIDSTTGIVIKKVGSEGSIYITPDSRRGVRLFDGKQYSDIYIIRPKKKRSVTLKYNRGNNTWTMEE